MNYTITKNNQFKSLEIKFEGKPSETIRNGLKKLKFKWHNLKAVWYGYAEENIVRELLDGKKEKPVKSEIKGLKVGDLLVAEWGYEQTNVSEFQVIALCGNSSVRVREVNVLVKDVKNCSAMAENLVLATTSKILEPKEYSVFIKDQEKGDIKRVIDTYGDIRIKISSFASAYKVKDGETAYSSWYY